MSSTSDDATMTAHEIGNLRFLIEHQLEVISTLELQGLDHRDASHLLGKLLRRDEELRRRMERAQHVARPDGAGSRPRNHLELRFTPDRSPIHADLSRQRCNIAAAPYMEGDRTPSG